MVFEFSFFFSPLIGMFKLFCAVFKLFQIFRKMLVNHVLCLWNLDCWDRNRTLRGWLRYISKKMLRMFLRSYAFSGDNSFLAGWSDQAGFIWLIEMVV